MGSFCWAGMPNLPAIQFAFTFVLFNIVVSRFENYRNQAQDFSNLSISRALEESVKKVRRLFPKAHHIKKRIFYPLFCCYYCIFRVREVNIVCNFIILLVPFTWCFISARFWIRFSAWSSVTLLIWISVLIIYLRRISFVEIIIWINIIR